MTGRSVFTAERRFYDVETRVGVYRNQYEFGSEESCGDLTHDSAAAILCFGFADLVVQGNNLYESINSLDNDWRKLVYMEQIDFMESFETRIKKLYAQWLEISRKVIVIYDRIESGFLARGFDANPVHELRKAIREVGAFSCKSDSDFFAHPKLVSLRDNALDDFHKGTDVEFDFIGKT